MSLTRISRVAALAVAAAALAVAAHPEAATVKKKAPAPVEDANPKNAPPADATAPAAHELGTVESWTAYEAHDKTGRVCFVYGQPTKREPPGTKRKQPILTVTHRPEGNAWNVVSVMEGYALRQGRKVALDVDRTKFELNPTNESAWAETPELDKRIVTAMTKGKQVVVKGDPSKGSVTTDTYPLAGFPKALALVDKACGAKR